MAKPKQLPSGNWRVQVFDYQDNSGKKHYKSFTSADKKQAMLMAAEYSANKEEVAKCSLSVSECVCNYISVKSGVLSPSTIRLYQGIERNNLVDIASLRINSLKSATIQRWIGNLSKTVSPKTIGNAYGLLMASIHMFAPSIIFNVTLPQKEKPKLHIPTNDEVKNIMEYAMKDDDLENAILLAAFGPLRRGEICALTSEDISGNTVTVSKSMVLNNNNTWELKAPKTYSSYRTVIMPDFVIDRIKYIDGNIIKITPSMLSNRFMRAINKAGLPHFRFHDLRHYAASIMHAIGVPDQYIMQRGGWATDNVMKTVYRTALSDQSIKQNEKINDYFSNISHEISHK